MKVTPAVSGIGPARRRSTPIRHPHWRPPLALLASMTAGALVLAACGSSSSGTASAGAKLSVGVVAPFTGSQAQLGKFIVAPCYGATRVINAAGGVLGHQLSCLPIDDTGDAADAVPNVTKALATNSSLAGVLGIDSNVAATIVPIVENAKLPMISTNGLSQFSTTRDTYFWRMTAPDVAGGAGMGLWASKQGYKRVAVVFQNDIGDLGNKPGMLPALQKQGIAVTKDVTIPGDASSYQSIVNQVRAAKPDAVILSADTQTSATFLSEYKGLNNGSVPPVIAPTDVLDPSFYSAIKKVMGATYVVHSLSFVGTYVDTTSPEFQTYYGAVKASPNVQAPEVVVATGAVASLYDGLTVLSLAMTAAHSTKGTTYNSFVPKVTTRRSGAVEVHTYAQGVRELKAGHQIYYVGVTGPVIFNQFHNSPGEFAAFTFTPSGGTKVLQVIPPAQIASVLH
ncbi:MAG TPA: ABC transporter substrate-binding protein [Streptosporangiaceae bacterium]|nr:ABC transporter substrate-binding protein [Streptosporangiaceae bacterium]